MEKELKNIACCCYLFLQIPNYISFLHRDQFILNISLTTRKITGFSVSKYPAVVN